LHFMNSLFSLTAAAQHQYRHQVQWHGHPIKGREHICDIHHCTTVNCDVSRRIYNWILSCRSFIRLELNQTLNEEAWSKLVLVQGNIQLFFPFGWFVYSAHNTHI